MNPWVQLYRQQQATRGPDPSWSATVRRRLVQLAERGHCDPSIQGRFTSHRLRSLNEWAIQPRDREEDLPRGTERLVGLPELTDATLTLLALTDSRQKHVHKLDIQLTGTTPDGQALVVAVHLEDDRTDKVPAGDRRGSGACGHAALHVHVGPSLQALPKVRVPLPAVPPADLLDWVLSWAVPGWEPAPWSQSPSD